MNDPTDSRPMSDPNNHTSRVATLPIAENFLKILFPYSATSLPDRILSARPTHRSVHESRELHLVATRVLQKPPDGTRDSSVAREPRRLENRRRLHNRWLRPRHIPLPPAVVPAPQLLNPGRHDIEVRKPLSVRLLHPQTLNKYARLVFPKRTLNDRRHAVATCLLLPSPMPAPRALDFQRGRVLNVALLLRITNKRQIPVSKAHTAAVNRCKARHRYTYDRKFVVFTS